MSLKWHEASEVCGKGHELEQQGGCWQAQGKDLLGLGAGELQKGNRVAVASLQNPILTFESMECSETTHHLQMGDAECILRKQKEIYWNFWMWMLLTQMLVQTEDLPGNVFPDLGIKCDLF